MALSIAAGLSTASVQVWSQDLLGRVVEPAAKLPLRANPPSLFFTPPGDQVGEAAPQQEYKVLGQRRIPTISGGQQWLQLESVERPELRGWVYSGPGGNPTANVQATR